MNAVADGAYAGPGPKNPAEAALGELIRNSRRAGGLTQGELAEGICARAYVSRIENGARFPAPAILKLLADRLGLPLPRFAPAYIMPPMAGVEQCLELARIQAKDGDVKGARHSYGRALALHEFRGKPAPDIPALRATLGIILLNEGRYEECGSVLTEALERYFMTGKPTGLLAEIYIAIGLSLVKRGRLKKAIGMFQKSFNIVFAIGADGTPKQAPGMGRLQNETVEWLIRVMALQRRFNTALTVYDWAINIWGHHGIYSQLPPAIVILKAGAELGTGQPDEAERSLLGLLESGACAGRPRLSAAVHNNLAVTYRLMENWERARYHATAALDLWEGDSPGRHASANELAFAAFALGDYKGAKRALAFTPRFGADADPVPDPIWAAETFLLRARVALAEGDVKPARLYLERAERVAEGVRWVQTMVHIEGIEADLSEGLPASRIRSSLAVLRSSVAKWSM